MEWESFPFNCKRIARSAEIVEKKSGSNCNQRHYMIFAELASGECGLMEPPVRIYMVSSLVAMNISTT